MRLVLPVNFHNEQTNALKNLDINFSSELYEARDVILYHVHAIAPYLEEGLNWTSVFTGMAELICPLPMEEVDKLIEEAKKQEK